MLRYFFVSIAIAVAVYIALRLTVGGVILPAVDPRVASDMFFLVPGLVAVFIAAWVIRPAVRAHSLLGPVFATLAYPFVAGGLFVLGMNIFGDPDSVDLVENLEGTVSILQGVPFTVIESLRVTIPLSIVAVFLLRSADPPEKMRKKNLATVDPYG